MATTQKKPARQAAQEPRQAPIAEGQGQGTAQAQERLPGGPRPGDGQAHPHALDPERLPARPATLDDGFAPPFLTAARSHLDRPANPKPAWPDTQGLYGTGAISVLARLDEAMEFRKREHAEQVDVLRLPPQVGAYRAEVLAWFAREGL